MKRWFALSGLVFGSGTVAALVGAAQITENVSVKDKYVSSGGSTLEALGVCHVTEDDVSCWDLSGKPAKNLEAKVEQALLQRSREAPFPRFQYRAKNRLVVLRTQIYLNESFSLEWMRSPGGSSGGATIQEPLVDAPSELRVETILMPLAFERDQKTTFVQFATQKNLSLQTPVKLAPGSTFSIAGSTITLLKPDVREPIPFNLMQQKEWNFSLRIDPPFKQDAGLSALAVGKDGATITSITNLGKIPTKRDLLEREKRRAEGLHVPTIYPNIEARITAGSNVGNLSVNVDPAIIDHLSLAIWGFQKIRIVDLPLDPLPSPETTKTSARR